MRFLTTFMIAALVVNGRAQSDNSTGTELWVTFMENLGLQMNGPPSFELVISSDANTSGEVQVPATGFSIPFTVQAMHDTVLLLPTNIYYPEGDETIFDYGLRIVADAPVSVYAYHHRLYFSEACMALPLAQLGTDYRVIAHVDVGGMSPAEMVVMATEDGTEVEITPSVVTAGFRPPDVPFTQVLDEGQVFQIQAYGDLSGSRIRSLDPDKPIAVFAGARQAKVGCGGFADDHLFQAIAPVQEWGQDFVVVPFKDRGGDEFVLLSSADGTEVQVGNAPPITLDEGEHAAVTITTARRITATAPIAVGQFNDSQDCNPQPGDPCFLWNFPTSRRDPRLIWTALTGDGIPEHYVNIVVSGAAGAPPIYLDGVNVASSFLPVPDVTGTFYAQLSISEGEHLLEHEQGAWSTAYGFGLYNSYSFPLGFEEITTAIGEEGSNADHLAHAWMASAGDPLPRALSASGTITLFDASGRMAGQCTSGPAAAWPDLPEGHYTLALMPKAGGIVHGRVVIVAER